MAISRAQLSEAITEAYWEPRKVDLIKNLMDRGFSHDAAVRASDSFIKTQYFVARLTGVPQIGTKKE